MTDLNTGALLGCLNAQGEVQNIETTGTTGPCNQFTAVPSSAKGQGGSGAVIFASPGVPCTFRLIDGPGSEDQFMCDISFAGSTTLNVWSLQGQFLSTSPQGSQFAEFTDGFFEAAITTGDTGTTPISLSWVQ